MNNLKLLKNCEFYNFKFSDNNLWLCDITDIYKSKSYLPKNIEDWIQIDFNDVPETMFNWLCLDNNYKGILFNLSNIGISVFNFPVGYNINTNGDFYDFVANVYKIINPIIFNKTIAILDNYRRQIVQQLKNISREIEIDWKAPLDHIANSLCHHEPHVNEIIKFGYSETIQNLIMEKIENPNTVIKFLYDSIYIRPIITFEI